IFSDSKSTLQAIRNPLNCNPLINLIQNKLVELINRNYEIELVWIPSHQGITGNETADQEAKEATKKMEPDRDLIPAPKDLNKYIKALVKNHWDDKWRNGPSSKLHQVRESITENFPQFYLSRIDQVVLSRLRIGHTKMTHSHIMTKEPSPQCQRCGEILTIKHILIECNNYNPERRKTKLPNNMKSCLDDHSGCLKTLQFIKIIKLFKEI
ncbi:GSCOCG00013671001-RA-CDS, partial [Cotesia congregata]